MQTTHSNVPFVVEKYSRKWDPSMGPQPVMARVVQLPPHFHRVHPTQPARPATLPLHLNPLLPLGPQQSFNLSAPRTLPAQIPYAVPAATLATPLHAFTPPQPAPHAHASAFNTPTTPQMPAPRPESLHKSWAQSARGRQVLSQLRPLVSKRFFGKSGVCPICKKVFAHKYNLVPHMLIHLGVRPFKCDVCGRAFTQLSNMKRHKQTVHEKRPRRERRKSAKSQATAQRRRVSHPVVKMEHHLPADTTPNPHQPRLRLRPVVPIARSAATAAPLMLSMLASMMSSCAMGAKKHFTSHPHSSFQTWKKAVPTK